MKRFLPALLSLVLCASLEAPIRAEVDFFSYQRTLVPTYQDTVKTYYDTQYNLIQLGNSQLDADEITVVPKGAYLDIVEDAWKRQQSLQHTGAVRSAVHQVAILDQTYRSCQQHRQILLPDDAGVTDPVGG